MLKEQMLYALRDISVIPAVSTDIKSRKECNPFRKSIESKELFYPLIASPMDSVLDDTTWKRYWDNKISCIIPRTVPLEKRVEMCTTVFCAFSLKEAKDLFLNAIWERKKGDNIKFYVLIDIANGSMLEEIETGKNIKEFWGSDVVLMGGNIGNPQTYLLYEAAGFDFVRCGVGAGNGCLTSTNTAIHFPYASLISDISDIKYRCHSNCKIIIDGGMSGYSDIIKSLALGADYVMCGRIFAQAADTQEELGTELIYRGMSTKEAQKAMGNTVLKTSEGRSVQIKKQYTLSGWVENFDSYLRSAMSYCDSRTLEEFRKKAICQVISPNASSQINDK